MSTCFTLIIFQLSKSGLIKEQPSVHESWPLKMCALDQDKMIKEFEIDPLSSKFIKKTKNL